uniref:RING-type E3 ubiquitin transferase n=1 Tax=Lactuca sativa TaxID=4236 RepID=A0A9R1WGZ4_LACSA|nr:hypothetical protein LSAT_V11C200068300 [Lactuca sativa]
MLFLKLVQDLSWVIPDSAKNCRNFLVIEREREREREMEEERESTRYWCHACDRVVDPVMEVESVKCSVCHGGFVEEMGSVRRDDDHHHHQNDGGSGSDSDRGISFWAPILLTMMDTPRRHRRFRQLGLDEANEEQNRHQGGGGGESELDPEQRRRRSTAAIFHLLQGIQAGMASESENNEEVAGGDRDSNQEQVILINPFTPSIIVHGGSGGNPFDSRNLSQNHPFGSFGDYFIGPGLEQLLQQLSENDPNRYGTPPAKKEAIESMPKVKIEEDSIQCSVCLEEFEIENEAREMPCKHRFHGDCILPWLELHSSCPVCRYQMPADESKVDREQEGSRGIIGNSSNGVTGESGNRNNEERRFSVSFPWPFSSLFSSPRANTVNLGSSTVTRSSSGDSGSQPRAHEHDHNTQVETTWDQNCDRNLLSNEYAFP